MSKFNPGTTIGAALAAAGFIADDEAHDQCIKAEAAKAEPTSESTSASTETTEPTTSTEDAEAVYAKTGDLCEALECFGFWEGKEATKFARQHGAISATVRNHNGMTYVEYVVESGSGDDWVAYSQSVCLG